MNNFLYYVPNFIWIIVGVILGVFDLINLIMFFVGDDEDKKEKKKKYIFILSFFTVVCFILYPIKDNLIEMPKVTPNTYANVIQTLDAQGIRYKVNNDKEIIDYANTIVISQSVEEGTIINKKIETVILFIENTINTAEPSTNQSEKINVSTTLSKDNVLETTKITTTTEETTEEITTTTTIETTQETTTTTETIENNILLSAYDSTGGYSELSQENKVKIAGAEYDSGLSFNLGASYNIWGNGTQYALYNISDISSQYNTINFFIGHVDTYDLVDVELKIYTSTINEEFGTPDMYKISSDSMFIPIAVNISGKDTMKIEINCLGSPTKYGIFNISFE